MSTNNKISTLIASQVPFFVRNDHEKFMLFIEAYYEYLEQTDPTLGGGKVIERAKNLQSYSDIDTTLDGFTDYLYAKFLKDFPTNSQADLSTILKNSKDFYRAKGSEKATRFLLRALFDKEIDFYYPKKDVLRASDGKWYIKKSLRVSNTAIESVANTDYTALQKYIGKRVRGSTSNATAIVEEVDRFYDTGQLVDELVISSIAGTFENGENVSAVFLDGTTTYNISSAVFDAGLTSITVTKPGSGYLVGDPVTITSNTGSGAIAVVSRVSSGNIGEIVVFNGGAGYKVGDNVAIVGGGGSGATANVANVSLDTVHPNTYNIIISLITSEQNTVVTNTTYSNINSLITDPFNVSIQNVLSSFLYANSGPAQQIRVITKGNNYSSLPSIGIIANTRIQEAGIIGRIDVLDGGLGYSNTDFIEFINGPYSYGYGARANVEVYANGKIFAARLVANGTTIGGEGYDQNYLPTANVVTSTGNGAVINVYSTLGFGGEFLPANSSLGAIERITISERGTGYATAPTISLTSHGDGTAQAYSNISVSGVITYPGRYLNDDGQLSAFNFLQDRDYYQNFSYVVRIEESLDKFKLALKNLLHPAGMKLFADHVHPVMDVDVISYNPASETSYYKIDTKTYSMSNNIVVNAEAHGRIANDRVTLEFTSGNAVTANANGEYVVKSVINANSFIVYSGTKLMGAANVIANETSATGIYFKDDGSRMYIVGSGSDRIFEYSLPRAFDVTSAVYSRMSKSLSTQDSAPTGVYFKPDGNRVYISGDTNDRIVQYDLDEKWNANTVNVTTNVRTFSVAGQDSAPQTVKFNPSGNMMYIIGTSNDRLYQYRLTEAWNIATSSLIAFSNATTALDTTPVDFMFANNGNTVLVLGQTSKKILQYNMTEAYNVNTISYIGSTIALNFTTATGMEFSNTGNMLYVSDIGPDLIIQLPLSESYNVFTAKAYAANTGNVLFGRTIV